MYKVLIVEDEAGIRRRLRSAIDWEQMNCTICGDADSGMSGFEAILRLKPDIVVTDIVMPGINGIMLLQYIRQKDEQTQFIMITGYQEFEYAQEALRLGATALLTKPIVLEELKKAMLQAVFRINQYNTSKKAEAEPQNNEQAMLTILLKDQVASKALRDNLAEHFGIRDQAYVAACFTLNTKISDKDYRLTLSLQDTLHKTLQNHEIHHAVIDDTKLCVLVTHRQIPCFSEESVLAYFVHLHNEMRLAFPDAFSVSISAVCSRGNELPRAWAQCQETERMVFFNGPDSVNMYRPQTGNATSKEDIFQEFFELMTKKKEKPQIREALRLMILRQMERERLDENTAKGIVISALTYALVKFAKNDPAILGLVFSKIEFYNVLIGVAYQDELIDAAADSMMMMREYITLKKHHSRSEVIAKLEAYVEENYTSSITLTSAAEVVYLSPSYLSTMVRMETNQSFVELVNQTRIRHAKPMLLRENAKIGDIAAQVGFEDPHYFGQVFKKMTGVSPSEYIRLNH